MVAQHSYETRVIREDFYAPEDRQYEEAVFTFAACIRCERPLLARRDFSIFEGLPHPQNDFVRVYPTDEAIPEAVPEMVARPYREAQKAYGVKIYAACVLMCRKCVEAVCVQHGESEGTLAARLDLLQKKGVIDNALFEWTKELRLSGNDAAHDATKKTSEAEAKNALEFAKAVLIYAFELPRRLQSARRHRNS